MNFLFDNIEAARRGKNIEYELSEIHNKVFSTYFPGKKVFVGGGLGLTNRYWFVFQFGYVSSFRSDANNWFTEQDIVNLERYVGKDNMTTNEAIELARDSFRKLGYKPEDYQMDGPPTNLEGPIDATKLGHIPFCRIEWNSPEPTNLRERDLSHRIRFDVDMQRKQVVGMSLWSTNFWRPNPQLDVETELESDYRKRMRKENPGWVPFPRVIESESNLPSDDVLKSKPEGFKGSHSKMFVRTNAPPQFSEHTGVSSPISIINVSANPPAATTKAPFSFPQTNSLH